MVDSTFIDDTTELNPWIESATADLYDFLVSRFGAARFAKNAWINVRHDWAEGAGYTTDPSVAWPNNVQSCTAVAGTNEDVVPLVSVTPSPGHGIASGYLLPADFRRLVRIHFTPGYVAQVQTTRNVPLPVVTYNNPVWRLVTTGDGSYYPMRPLDLEGGVIDTKQRSWTEFVPEYRLVHGPHNFGFGAPTQAWLLWTNATIIQFLPPPAARYAVQLFYVPKVRVLPDDIEEFGYDFPEWIIFECAAQCLEKQESDARPLRAKLESVKNRIQNDARTIDVANPKTVSMSSGYHAQVGQNRRRGAPWPR